MIWLLMLIILALVGYEVWRAYDEDKERLSDWEQFMEGVNALAKAGRKSKMKRRK